jgi:hypothetical protein
MLSVHFAGAAQADEWFGYPIPQGGYQVSFGADDGESTLFHAWCETPGADVRLWYLADRETVAEQAHGANGMREPVDGLSITLLVDGHAFSYQDASARPEEMYGGNEIIWTTALADPLIQALADGLTLSLVIDGEEGDRISLRGSSHPFSTFRSNCGD